jgi:16S rRNA (guanine966-N2)-methyltransferase
MIKINSGNYRGTQLIVPDGQMVRPSSSRIREAIFNILQHRYDFQNFLIWDAYAGSGALGLEAWSRGGEGLIFTESNPVHFKILRQNLRKCGLSVKTAFLMKALQWLDNYSNPAKILVFLDPPYQSEELSKIIPKLANSKNILIESLVIVETDSKVLLNWPSQFELVVSKNYGHSKIEIAEKLEIARW